jgi:hypothetical protein
VPRTIRGDDVQYPPAEPVILSVPRRIMIELHEQL